MKLLTETIGKDAVQCFAQGNCVSIPYKLQIVCIFMVNNRSCRLIMTGNIIGATVLVMVNTLNHSFLLAIG